MPEGDDATIGVCNIMSFVLYTQILKQSVLKPASPGITLRLWTNLNTKVKIVMNGGFPGQEWIECLY